MSDSDSDSDSENGDVDADADADADSDEGGDSDSGEGAMAIKPSRAAGNTGNKPSELQKLIADAAAAATAASDDREGGNVGGGLFSLGGSSGVGTSEHTGGLAVAGTSAGIQEL